MRDNNANLNLPDGVRWSVIVLTICASLSVTSANAQVNYGDGIGNSISRIATPRVWIAQRDNNGERHEDQDNYRSKSDVMREVKRRYDARVLKITLNKKRHAYRVRLLMPNGKVRNISVSAHR